MIKSIFESKYIKMTTLITCVVITMICFLGIRVGSEIVIHTVCSEDASFADIEGYIIDKNESGKKIVVDFLTGKTVFEPKGEDNIVTYYM